MQDIKEKYNSTELKKDASLKNDSPSRHLKPAFLSSMEHKQHKRFCVVLDPHFTVWRNILQNIFLCALQKENLIDFEQHELGIG